MSLSGYFSVRFFKSASIFGVGMLESRRILLGNQNFMQYDSEKKYTKELLLKMFHYLLVMQLPCVVYEVLVAYDTDSMKLTEVISIIK